jgi:hypothetical protein
MGGGSSNPFDALDPSNIEDAIVKPIEDSFNDNIVVPIEDGIDQVGDEIKQWALDTIWKPIDEGLIIPAEQFFDMVTMYINCAVDKITNFWRCFIWYVIYIIQESLNIIIVGFCFIINQITGNNSLLDFYNLFLNYWGKLSDIFDEYTGFQLLIFPYSDNINAECFVCKADIRTPIIQTELQNIKQEIQTETQNFTGFTKQLANDIAHI